jgi:hypothetical protein
MRILIIGLLFLLASPHVQAKFPKVYVIDPSDFVDIASSRKSPILALRGIERSSGKHALGIMRERAQRFCRRTPAPGGNSSFFSDFASFSLAGMENGQSAIALFGEEVEIEKFPKESAPNYSFRQLLCTQSPNVMIPDEIHVGVLAAERAYLRRKKEDLMRRADEAASETCASKGYNRAVMYELDELAPMKSQEDEEARLPVYFAGAQVGLDDVKAVRPWYYVYKHNAIYLPVSTGIGGMGGFAIGTVALIGGVIAGIDYSWALAGAGTTGGAVLGAAWALYDSGREITEESAHHGNVPKSRSFIVSPDKKTSFYGKAVPSLYFSRLHCTNNSKNRLNFELQE